MHFAAFLGGAGTVDALLDAGADPNAVSDNPMRVQPLHSAAALGDVEACRNGYSDIASRLRESSTSPLSD